MNWVAIISYSALAVNLGAFAYSMHNIRKYDKIFRRHNDRAAELVRELAVLDPRIDTHRLRFALYAAMAGHVTIVPDDSENRSPN